MEPDAETIPTATITPTPEQVLAWIAAAGDSPWFPSAHSKRSGIPREAFDPPLNELRGAELVRVVDWVREVGQGYALASDGKTALEAIARARDLIANPPSPEAAVSPSSPPEAPKPAIIDLRPPIITPALLMANLLWFFVGLVVATRLGVTLRSFLLEGDRTTFARLGAVAAPDLLRGDWWRLATCCFVHGSIWHLLINLFNLGMIGALAELLWGRWRVLLIYLIAGFAGSCLALALHPLDASHHAPLLVGASGAIWGLATSVVAWMLLFHRRLPRDLVVDLTRRLGVGFALSIAVSLLPGVSWQAHLGGAAAGFAAAIFLNEMRFGRGYRRALALVAVAMMPALCAGGVLLAIQCGEQWAPLRPAPAPPPVPGDPTQLLESLAPMVVNPTVNEAGQLLILDPKRRKPERMAEVRGRVKAFWSNAMEASQRLTPALGDAAVDANRARAKQFADARVESLGRLLGMLDAIAIPDVPTWKDWGERHRAADRLWNDIEK